MKRKILFIGAGASRGAREDCVQRPPLGDDLLSWLRTQVSVLLSEIFLNDLHSTLREGADVLKKHLDQDNYEILVSTLDRNDRIALQRLLQVCFSDLADKKKTDTDLGFRSMADGYDALIYELDIGSGNWVIFSLNYDLLFEEALWRKNIAFQYQHFPFAVGQDQSREPGVRIYKPHGSINFFAQPDDIHVSYGEEIPESDWRQPLEFSFDENGNPTPEYPTVFAGMKGTANVLTRANSWSLEKPVMANYMKGKRPDANLRTLELVRKDALAIAYEADEIVVIGVKPVVSFEEDHFTYDLLQLNIPNLIYVTKDAADGQAVKTIHPHAEIHWNGLSKFLESTKKSRGF